jgi:hypothetical protein
LSGILSFAFGEDTVLCGSLCNKCDEDGEVITSVQDSIGPEIHKDIKRVLLSTMDFALRNVHSSEIKVVEEGEEEKLKKKRGASTRIDHKYETSKPKAKRFKTE